MTSDARIKTNIVEANLDECLSTICALQLKEFDYHPRYAQRCGLANTTPYWGLIAQDVETVAPFCVTTHTGTRSWCSCDPTNHCDGCEPLCVENLKSLDAHELNMAAFGAIKRLQQKNEHLTAEMGNILVRLTTLENTPTAR